MHCHLSSLVQELESEQVEYELKEGPLHDGIGAVTRYVWRKAQA
jgi:hypothetical protein